MSSDDVRNRFRSNGRRDYDGPMPSARPPEPVETPKLPTSQPQKRPIEYQPPLESKQFEEPNPTKMKKSKRKYRKLWIAILVFLIFGVAVGGAFWKFYMVPRKSNNQAVAVSPTEQQPTPQQEQTTGKKKSIRLVATGDMIPHGAILEQGKKTDGTYDFSSMLANMKPYFEKSDVNFCNQATPAGGASFGYSGYPVFNAPLEWPRAIEGVGCNVINIGSNHTNDKGQPLIDATVAAWDNRPNVLAVVGANRSAAEQAKIRYFEKEGVKFAILSYSTYTNTKLTTTYGINMYDKATADKQIAEARKNADIVLVSMRWGTEYSAGINAEQDRIAQELSNAGADIVLGHGPHSMEPVKKLTGTNGNPTMVYFSLGNFLNAQLETESLIGGFAIFDIDTTTKTISGPMFMPVYVHYEWTLAQKAANDLLGRKNFSMYPLDKAAEPMSKSLIGTTVEAQTDRVTKLLNTYTKVMVIKSDQY